MSEEKKKNPVGRPRTKITDLPPNWREIMHDEAQIGGGQVAFLVKLGLNNQTYYTLLEDSIEFQECVEECKSLAQYWFENQGRRMVGGGSGNSNVFALMMNNKFGWNTQKTESKVVQEVKADVTTANRDLTKDELLKQLQARGLPTTLLIESKEDES